MVRLFYAEFVPLDFRYSRNWPLATSAFAFTITITFSFFNDESNVIMDQEQHAPNISKWFAKEIWDIVSFGSQFHEFERKKKKELFWISINVGRSALISFFDRDFLKIYYYSYYSRHFFRFERNLREREVKERIWGFYLVSLMWLKRNRCSIYKNTNLVHIIIPIACLFRTGIGVMRISFTSAVMCVVLLPDPISRLNFQSRRPFCSRSTLRYVSAFSCSHFSND